MKLKYLLRKQSFGNGKTIEKHLKTNLKESLNET